jgi:hypothetical protein
MSSKPYFTIAVPKVKGRGKLPPPPAIHPDKIKNAKKKACRAKLNGKSLEDF